jgi:hypothetical protein
MNNTAFKETYFSSLPQINNQVYAEVREDQATRPGDQSWSQVFDLGDTVLVW